jgi:uncharacterized protein (DUF4213/DUF364 family)
VALALLQQAQAIAQVHPPPAVRALHLPHPAPGQALHDAEFCALELQDGSFGLSYLLLGDALQALLREHGAAAGPAPLAGASPLALAARLVDGSPVQRALALAALNALTDSAWRRIGYEPPAASNSLGDVQLGPLDHLGMIGFFPPLVQRLHDAGGRLSVVELDAATVARQQQRYPGLHITQDRNTLAACNVVVGTSTMLLNDTLDAMLAAAPQARRFAIIGPSAGLWPDALFERGVTFMGGTRITDGAALREALQQGASWSAATRKFAIHRDSWPGWQRLLAR